MKNDSTLKEYHDLLDKMLKIQNGRKDSPVSVYKIILCVASCICLILFVGLLCFLIYKNNYSLESILSLLMAFFSIFISIFFYFKADETSAKFYNNSYDFMKDVSVTLGKIEERFGEKLNSMNEKLSHIEKKKEETAAELETAESEKDKLINELMEKAKLTTEEKEKYHAALQVKENETTMLRDRLQRMEHQLRISKDSPSQYIQQDIDDLSTFISAENLSIEDINGLLKNNIDSLSQYQRFKARRLGLIDGRNKLTHKGRMWLEEYLINYSLNK